MTIRYGAVIDPAGTERAADLHPDHSVWYSTSGGKCDGDTAETFEPYRRVLTPSAPVATD